MPSAHRAAGIEFNFVKDIALNQFTNFHLKIIPANDFKLLLSGL